MPLVMPHEKVTRRIDDAPALAGPDAGKGAAAVSPRLDLYDHEPAPVAGDEIQLAQPAAIASGNDGQPMVLEKPGCARLPGLADSRRVGPAAHRAVNATPLTGSSATGRPP